MSENLTPATRLEKFIAGGGSGGGGLPDPTGADVGDVLKIGATGPEWANLIPVFPMDSVGTLADYIRSQYPDIDESRWSELSISVYDSNDTETWVPLFPGYIPIEEIFYYPMDPLLFPVISEIPMGVEYSLRVVTNAVEVKNYPAPPAEVVQAFEEGDVPGIIITSAVSAAIYEAFTDSQGPFVPHVVASPITIILKPEPESGGGSE